MILLQFAVQLSMRHWKFENPQILPHEKHFEKMKKKTLNFSFGAMESQRYMSE